MKLRIVGVLVSVLGAILGFVSAAHAHIWTGPLNHTGIDYTLSVLTEKSSATRAYSFLLDASGYSQPADPSIPDSASVKAWDGETTAFAFFGRTVESPWTLTNGSVDNGGYNDCRSRIDSLACAGASTKELSNAASSGAYSPTIQVIADGASAGSSSSSPAGTQVGAAHKNSQGALQVYGTTSVAKPIPEPKIYAMMLAGLGLMGFVAQRRHNGSAA